MNLYYTCLLLFFVAYFTFSLFAIIIIAFAFNAPLEQSEKWFYWSIQNLFMFIALMFSIISGIIYEISFLSKQKMIKNS